MCPACRRWCVLRLCGTREDPRVGPLRDYRYRRCGHEVNPRATVAVAVAWSPSLPRRGCIPQPRVALRAPSETRYPPAFELGRSATQTTFPHTWQVQHGDRGRTQEAPATA